MFLRTVHPQEMQGAEKNGYQAIAPPLKLDFELIAYNDAWKKMSGFGVWGWVRKRARMHETQC